MRRIIFIVVMISFNSCYSYNNNEVLKGKDWSDILIQSLGFSGVYSDTLFLYNKFENIEFADSLCKYYSKWSDIYVYNLNDSITTLLKNRSNSIIVNKLDTLSLIKIEFVSDTIDFPDCLLKISEPIIFDGDKLIYSVSMHEKKGNVNSWIFYFDIQTDYFKLLSIYDYQKNKLFVGKAL